jgi:cytochrome c-type biogenesis protein CcmE
MTDMTWEKPSQPVAAPRKGERTKFLIGGVLIIAAVLYLIISGTTGNTQYFMTVASVQNSADYVGKTVRLSGAVIGETIQYDSQNLILDFTIANIPQETQNLALTLHEAVSDPGAARMKVHLENQVKPDLLQHEAQAILTGALGEDGVFYATEILLKCPSRYEESVPDQSIKSET